MNRIATMVSILMLLCPGAKTQERMSPMIWAGIGTPGLGFGYSRPAGERFTITGEVSYLALSTSLAASLAYQNVVVSPRISDLQLGARADLYPFSSYRGAANARTLNPFRVSMGLYFRNSGKYKARARPSDSYMISGFPVTRDQLGYVDIRIMTKRLLPYAGAGFDWIFGPNSRCGIGAELGVFYHGKPRVEMTATGILEDNAENAEQLEKNLNPYRWYPNLRVRLNYYLNQ